MQINKFLLTGILYAFGFLSKAQAQTSSVSGAIHSGSGEPIPGATVKLQNSSWWAVSDENGFYIIKGIAPGSYTITVSAISFKSQKKEIKALAGKAVRANFIVRESSMQMDAVTVIGRTAVQETNRQAFNVTAVDAKKLYNTTLDISGALDKVAGVRVRESGGVGSNFNLSLNGFSGNHIRYFIDGIPMDNFGSSFQINNIPINIAERIEVYKGVVPMWLGSDALGGAINIVTGDRYRNYIDASYSFGSFNTHRSVINTTFTSQKGFTVQLNAFQNYSDNNYKVKVEAWDIYTGAYEPETALRRFHDTYHNETLIANAGLVDKSFADKLLLGITLGRNYKEIQTGARMQAVFGAWHRRGNIVMPSLKYKKDNLIKGLDVTINANYNFGYEQNIDTANVRYDWYGNSKPNGSNGERSRTLAKYNNNNGLATAMLNYKIDERQSLALNNVFNTFNRKASDKLNPTSTENDKTRKLNKNILGLGYTYNVEDKWSAAVFGKYISQNTVNDNASGQPGMKKFGYGTALTYFINRNTQLKASYELTNRLPEAQEVFGDLENLEGNPNLKPERSDNVNLGINYGFALNQDNRFSLTANAIYRYSGNFIYSRLNQNQSKLVLDNREGVRTIGGDAEIRYSYKNWLTAGATLTYQHLKNLQLTDLNSEGQSVPSDVYGDQMPNIPYLFANADVSVLLKNFGKSGNNLNIVYNTLFVNEFWLIWPTLGGRQPGDEKRKVPTQLSHDLSLVYTLKNGRYNIALEGKNLTNERLFDNFSLQKPSRGFYLNLRYFLNRNNH